MKNKWVSLLAGLLIQIILGGIYAWSPLLSSLGETYNLTKGQGGFIFGVCITAFTLIMVGAGRFLVTHGPQLTSSIGAFLFTSGYLLASFSNGSYIMLLLSLGVLTGFGIGFAYVCPLTVGMKWFPNNKGLVTGISVAGFGSGAIVLSAVAEHYLSSGMDVLLFFRLWGIVSGSILLIASLVLMEPVAPKKSKIKRAGVKEIKSKQFFICAIGIFAGTFLGLFINGNLIPILSENGIPHHQALKAIPLFAVGNALGRITWGHFFDTLGYKSIPISLIGLSIVSLFLILPLSSWVLFLDIILIGFFFGSNFVIYASSIARYFGQTLFSTLYPMVFLAYGIAGFIAPGIGGYFIDLTGSFHISLFVAISIVLSAGVFSIVRLTVFNNSIPAKHS